MLCFSSGRVYNIAMDSETENSIKTFMYRCLPAFLHATLGKHSLGQYLLCHHVMQTKLFTLTGLLLTLGWISCSAVVGSPSSHSILLCK